MVPVLENRNIAKMGYNNGRAKKEKIKKSHKKIKQIMRRRASSIP